MSRIERLTDAQIARFPEYVKKWTAIGLSTEPADRKRAEAGIVKAYKLAGLQPPNKIVWTTSPLASGLVRASVGDSVGASVWASVGDSVWASVWASVGDSVGASVWASVGDSVGASVWASVGDSVYGQHDAGWLSFYNYFDEVCGLRKQTYKLDGLMEVAQSANWFLPHQNICWVSERHNVLHLDDRGRLHNEQGAALAYPDGFAIYAVHGVRVPGQIIERPETITVKAIEDQSNAEIRRVMIERYGTPRYLLDSGAKKIHADERGTLYRKEIPDDEPLVMVGVRNSTPEPDGSYKDYFLRVPPEMQTASQAVAWTFEQDANDYAPVAES